MKILRFVSYPSLLTIALSILSAQNNSSSNSAKLYIKYYHVPIKQNIQSISSFGENIYALGDNYFELDGSKWVVPKASSKISDLSTFYVKNSNEVYLVKRAYPLNY